MILFGKTLKDSIRKLFEVVPVYDICFGLYILWLFFSISDKRKRRKKAKKRRSFLGSIWSFQRKEIQHRNSIDNLQKCPRQNCFS